MDRALLDRRRQRSRDPEDFDAALALARSLDRAGRSAEAFLLLYDAGGLERDDPLTRTIGARLAAEEEPIVERLTAAGLRLRLDEGERDHEGPLPVIAAELMRNFDDAHEPALYQLRCLRDLDTSSLSAPKLENLRDLPMLRALTFSNRAISDEELCVIAGSTRLRELWLFAASLFTEEGLRPIENLTELRYLDLTDTAVVGSILAPLTSLKQLEFFSLEGNPVAVEAEAFAPLGAMTWIKQLYLDFQYPVRHITDQIFPHLHGLRSLETLSLGFPIARRDYEQLAGFSSLSQLEIKELTADQGRGLASVCQLRWLTLQSNRVKQPGLPHALEGLRELEFLDLCECGLDDESLDPVGSLRALTFLDLADNPALTDASIARLAACRRLSRLDLDHSGVTDAGLEQLQELEALEWLSLSSTAITGRGLRALNSLTALSELYLYYCQGLTAADLEPLGDLPQLRTLGLHLTDISLEDAQSILPQVTDFGIDRPHSGRAELF